MFNDNPKLKNILLIFLTILILVIHCSDNNEKNQSNSSKKLKPIQANIVNYQKPFRRNSGLVKHLSIVVSFPNKQDGGSTFRLKYTILHKPTEKKFTDYIRSSALLNVEYLPDDEVKRFKVPNGYINFTEMVLKSGQDREPAITKNLKKEGNLWITKGFDFPTFNAKEYTIIDWQLEKYFWNTKTGQDSWKFIDRK